MIPGSIDTRAVIGRRRLAFRSWDEVIAETASLAAAARAGSLTTVGNWSLAEMFDHLANLLAIATGDLRFNAPWPMRVLGRTIGRRLLLGRELKPGMSLRGAAARLLPAAGVTLDAAEARLLSLLERIRAGERLTAPSPLLGPLTHEEWADLQLRHFAHHYSFLRPG